MPDKPLTRLLVAALRRGMPARAGALGDTPLTRRLVAALGYAASYNDKGYYWRRDSPETIREHQQSFQATLDGLAREVGPDALGSELAEAIASGAAARDDSGNFADLARCQFGTPPRGA